MFSRRATPFAKALILGFFCCLGSASADEAPVKEKVELISLNKVHPKSDDLAPKVEAGTEVAPEGYHLCEFPILDDETGKKTGTIKRLITTKAIVTSKHVQLARKTTNFGEIAILLTPEAGKLMSKATGKMEIGRDRMAVVIEGKGLIAPTVQATLGREFVINGLASKDEVQRIVKALSAPAKKAK